MDNQENVDELMERITETVFSFSRNHEISRGEVVLAMSTSMILLTERHCKKYNLRPDQVHQLHIVTGKTMKAALTNTMN